MNRISIRGVGLAAASVATLSFAVGATTAAADAPTSATTLVAIDPPDRALTAHKVGGAQVQAAARAAALAKAAQAKAAREKAAAAKAARAKAAREKAARAAAKARANRAINRNPVSAGSARAIGKRLAAARGWTGQQWICLDNLFTSESGWRTNASNASGAYGIPQALPGSKMASAGPDWRNNATTQITWGLGYVKGRYGTPCSAWSFFRSHHWY